MSIARSVAHLILGAGLALNALTLQAAAPDRAACEREFQPKVGQTGKDVIWVPTPDALVAEMLRLAQVGSQDVVYDLGAGDGKIPIAAGKLGAEAVGIEYDAQMVRLAQCLVGAAGTADRVRVVHGDIFKEDFSRATVVTMYLLPELNLCLRHRLLAMRPGTRVASHQFEMDDWKPDLRSERGSAYLWIVPAQVGGTWSLQAGDEPLLTLHLTQRFQQVEGEVNIGDSESAPISEASLRGDRLRFGFRDGSRVEQRFDGVVRGDQIVGTLKRWNRTTQVTAVRQAEAPPAAWAEMVPRCRDFYES
jgi:hypothetical protein